MADILVSEHSLVVAASDALIGHEYLSGTGHVVLIRGRKGNRVIVESLSTGNNIEIPLNYPLRLKITPHISPS